MQGTGTVVQNRITEPLNSGNGNVLTVPGFGTIEASCGAGGAQTYRLFWRNGLSGTTVDTWWSDGTVASGVVTMTYLAIAPGAGTYVAPVDTPVTRVVNITATYAGPHTVHAVVSAHASASGCVFSAQAVTQ